VAGNAETSTTVRRPQRLIRLAQHLATSLGLDIDQDSDVISEEELRELLNAAIDYVESAEEFRQAQISRPTLPGLIGTGVGTGTQWGTWTSTSPTYTYGGGGGVGNGGISDQRFFASVNAS